MSPIQDFWNQVRNAPLHIQLRRLRWNVPLIVVALAALHQFVWHTVASSFSDNLQWWVELLGYSLTGSLVAWLGISWIAAAVTRRAEAETKFLEAYEELEANHKKLLALHDLGQHVANADDEQSILELAAQAPLHLVGAQGSTVVTLGSKHERLKLDMAWGLSENYVRALRNQLDTGVPAERCRTCTILQAKSSSDCPLFEGLQPVATREGIGSLVCLPLIQDKERTGILSAYMPQSDKLPENQLHLLNILGGVVAASLENLQTRTQAAATLHALDRVTETSDALDDLAAQVLVIASAGWDAEAGGVFLYDEEEQAWSCRAYRGMGENLDTPRFDLCLQWITQVHETGNPIIRANLPPDSYDQLRSIAAIPLKAEGQVLGALFLGTEQRRGISEAHAPLLSTVAHQIALAIRNAQLYTRLSQMAVLEERLRLSREFHDGLAQTLGYLGLQAERLEGLVVNGQTEKAMQEFSEVRQSIRAAYVDVREAIDGLRLSADDPGRIADYMTKYVAAFSRQTGLQASFVAEPKDVTITSATALQLLRIAQEALTNVRKHAQAQRANVRLLVKESTLELTVTDDGRGFLDATQSRQAFRRHGLNSMRERTQSMGGALTIATGANRGTRITATIPLEVDG